MDTKLQLVAIVVTVVLFFSVLELVRRRRLTERYAILWLFASVILLVLAIWSDLLSKISNLVGVQVPSNALFAIGIGFGLVMMIHFSLSLSRLSTEAKTLAQEVARLDAELRAERAANETGDSRMAEVHELAGKPRRAVERG